MGRSWFRLGEELEKATGDMTDLISINIVIANDSKFEFYTVDGIFDAIAA